MPQTNDAKLSEIIAPAFYPIHWDLMDGLHTYYDLYGGRGSTKSSFIGVEIPLGMMQDPNANAIIFRKVGNTIGTSVYEQIMWGLEVLGVRNLWKCTTSPYRMTYIPTGQVILFRGLDKAKKMKSLKVARGYIKYLWFEELDEFAGEEEIRSVQQSVLRGGNKFVVFKSFNPPISKSNWANQYVLKPRRDALRHKSCYLDVPPAWLGPQFFDDAEALKEINPRAYQHEYLGDAVGTGGEVFENLELREITDEEIDNFDYTYMGLDFGWFPDPAHWSKMCYNPGQQTLYIYDELRVNKTSNAELWNMLVMKKGVTGGDLITADSAEPKSVADLKEYGALCRGAVKGPDSVKYSMKWLQSLKKIVIDPVRCPHTAREFSTYEYERTPDGEPMSAYPDADNHSIDSVRYGLNPVWRRKGQ
jgi:PBSX family phage terminase large subunit